ncbi:hypothetical protein [Ligilactobacillus equi]|uniref:ATP-dependent protease n=1 Tax=Ligilactobacillus equi DPC 6820 TaxID=1392007 RepID=V7HYM3_9LACO|nr:hypothetical protein [Ligilactobacillus equi]ETA74323.1 ATP-dependent protease [Ligilactobacillus equi DPC 6820]
MEKITEIVLVNFKPPEVDQAKALFSGKGRPQRKPKYSRKKIIADIQTTSFKISVFDETKEELLQDIIKMVTKYAD